VSEYKPLSAIEEALTISENDPEFLAAMEQAEEISLVQTADAFGDDLLSRLFEQPAIVGTAGLIPKLEDVVRVPPGQVTLGYGPNGHGKSLITSQVALDMAFQGEPVFMVSLEMAPVATLARMVKQSASSGTPSRRWALGFLEWARDMVWIYNRRGMVDRHRLLKLIRFVADRRGIKHVFIDSLMKLVRGEEDYDGQKEVVDSLCSLAMDAGIHVHLVHHIRKPKDENELFSKFDVKGSGAITDQVDTCIGVWRNRRKEEQRRQGKKDLDETLPDCIAIVDKNRHIEAEGRFGLYYVPGAQAYTDVRGKPIRYRLDDFMPEET